MRFFTVSVIAALALTGCAAQDDEWRASLRQYLATESTEFSASEIAAECQTLALLGGTPEQVGAGVFSSGVGPPPADMTVGEWESSDIEGFQWMDLPVPDDVTMGEVMAEAGAWTLEVCERAVGQTNEGADR